MPEMSVVIPASNSSRYLSRCLKALSESSVLPQQVIVVDDGSTDDTADVARRFGATVLATDRRRGPAFARNLGARAASGDILFFLDSDVCVRPETVSRVRESFAEDAQLDAVMGAYDDAPECQDFLSQYKNLMHAFVHKTGARQASTFWSGCGAIRRTVFMEQSGFDESYARPAIEDIELGYRLKLNGHRVVLDPSIQVTHLKRWTFWNLLKTDILERGIPWTELILRDRFLPNDLNLQLSQRVSVGLVFALVAVSAALAMRSGAYVLLPLIVIVFLVLAGWWSEAGAGSRPRRAFSLLLCLIACITLVAYLQRMYGLILPLLISPVLLIMKHRYNKQGGRKKWHRWLALSYLGASICTALFYMQGNRLLLSCFVLLAALGVLNSQFYIFLASTRGALFMLAAVPFHLLYHFYNGISFLIGVSRHHWKRTLKSDARP